MRIDNKITKGIIVGYNNMLIDNKILQIMKQQDEDIDYIRKSLQANRHNNITTTYYLCMKKFLKQGGKSKYDVTNP